jgi:diguanylate cyclase (GGDEF)-like protein
MNTKALSVLLVEGDAAVRQEALDRGLAVSQSADMALAHQHDAVLLSGLDPQALATLSRSDALRLAAAVSAVVVVADVDAETESELLAGGVDTVLPPSELHALARTTRQAVLRKKLERSTRTAYATDLATGLPHQAQLLEHMSQLLALREREPAPMVLLVLQVEGYATAVARLGVESANVLRRKVAVRLRSGLRASDVVAAVGSDAFGVLLGRLESAADGERVAAKLVLALQQPFIVAGQPCEVRAAVGLARYPEHGKQANALLQRATAQAGSVAAMGREGYAGRADRALGGAANDEDAMGGPVG